LFNICLLAICSLAPYKEKVKEWKASLPLDVNQVAQGAHMTQKYYMEYLLPKYINATQHAQLQSCKSCILQEDNDPSHGTKSHGNIAEILQSEN
jgi:hypothetical protein